MSVASTPITPVLLSGGSGSRLWPLSREAHPKQFLSLASERTLIQETAARVADPTVFGPLLVIANHDHRFLVAQQLREGCARVGQIVLEPMGRNTAAAAAVAALVASSSDPDAVILLMPSDHVIGDPAAFRAAIAQAASAARDGNFVLFGVNPTTPATGYGYIEPGSCLPDTPRVRRVASFVEKPTPRVAASFVDRGFLWNSGIFLLPAARLIAEMARLAPEVLAACERAVARASRDLDFIRLDKEEFSACPAVALDYAVMEKTDRASVMPVTFPWTDVGNWSALWEVEPKDHDGNAVRGDVVLHGASDCYVRTEAPLVAAIGVRDLVIIATADAVLVTDKAHDQEVKAMVDRLKTDGHITATQNSKVHRPWGFYQLLHAGERFAVKRITVNPGAKLSLQKHFHRAEHWVVVNGTALVTRDDAQTLLRENESIFVPLGCVHRLQNPGRVPLNLIEVQSGAYLAEDDIVRFEDDYARS